MLKRNFKAILNSENLGYLFLTFIQIKATTIFTNLSPNFHLHPVQRFILQSYGSI